MAHARFSRVIALIAAVQFVYILDFMMLLPLGADLARVLDFPADKLGWLSAGYTLASMMAGLVSVKWLDRFDRKSALLACLGALVLCTLATTWADSLWSLLLARALTGLCGGPAVAIGMAMVIDSTPPQARGQAIARVMIGFSLAAIAGVPMALELAQRGSWTTPFYVVAALAALVWIAVAKLLPSMRAHIDKAVEITPRTLLSRPTVRLAYLVQAASQFSAFLIIPSFAAYYLVNLGFPREHLSLLYLAGGIAALVLMQILGRLSDKVSPRLAVIVASVCFLLGLAPLFGLTDLPLYLPFVVFMAGNAGRNVSLAAITSQIPAAHERAGYMALQSMVQDIAITAAAMVSTVTLGMSGDGKITGTSTNAAIAAASATLVLVGLFKLYQSRTETPAPQTAGPTEAYNPMKHEAL
ncbi:MFS transporter [Chitinimonas sp. BJB300]|uniref:MFS transporter n=1 Tax=Chitinimonas sp. BJB300 TaxID=1559339 RepID=UPI000C0DD8BE|nr:MFS transporter [Chitinimonas sp. BJB300]PHV11868.1 MFS transporter [Chitinimonas sp. BJB300]TSJ87771.1 MFS transporter [Chitinimonas sp. BJB300]